MAKYFKEVEAQQYTGDLKDIKKFIGINDAEYDEESRVLFIPEDLSKPDGVRWTARVGDYVVKTESGFIVYKPTRFEKEFKQMTKDIKSESNTNPKPSNVSKEDVVAEKTTAVAAEEVATASTKADDTGNKDNIVADKDVKDISK